ncbi:helix-turn-helix domain-containing protein [Rhodoblastus acidophilus]|jgi:putative molybdopterin biosynthesis protein|uniref:Helix-turn-helix domain-containing protein n=1 Tax=Rhodoblastus acidophilus TaxID=1074 RepID=A0A6N8DHU0_RHOAC|nr:helix-turn-helix transcriptional regulator [Rhodoblastus acidophilus]MCW2272910.1 excisionase family DNA binding protein [Rhodoblastus acidophilus]MTV29817.1 helix-turn-helix domain-containing protein [Rhodoblastus acidophilus]
MSEFYTTRELAALLRVKERKVYDLAASGEIPVRRVTGKLLFPRDAIGQWLDANTPAVTPSPSQTERPLIAAGGHDPLLEWALRESGSGIAGFLDGAVDGLKRAEADQCILAGLHIPEEGGWNVATVEARFAQKPWVLIEWARRRRGLILRPGLVRRPENLKGVRGLRFQARQAESGSELVLDRLLAAESMTRADLHTVAAVERSEMDLAMSLAQGNADVGLGIEAAARQFQLDFVPLIEERFDLLVWRKAYFDPPFQKLIALTRSDRFFARANALGGYDVSALGAVHMNGA